MKALGRAWVLPVTLLLLNGACEQDAAVRTPMANDADTAASPESGHPDGETSEVGSGESAVDVDQEWARVSSRVLEFGEVDGATEFLFDRIRAVRLLSDGGVLVADGSSQELRVFSPQGVLEARFGGGGSGPGEFLYLQSSVVIPGDSIAVYDSRSHRFSLFTRSGVLIRDHRLPGSGGIGDELVGHLRGETYLFAKRVMPLDGPEGVQRGRVHYLRVDLGGTSTDTLASVPGSELEFVRNESGYWTTYEIPFARTALHDVGWRGTWVGGANDRFEIIRRDTDGQVQHVAALPEAEVRLNPDDVAKLETATIERLNPTGPRLASIHRLFHEVPAPELQPSFSRLIVDDADRLWAESWLSPFAGPSPDPRLWRVFDDSGAYLGLIALPASFELHDVRGDRMAGVEVDSVGVERVVVLRFSR